jgi:predicted small metal-binding protein
MRPVDASHLCLVKFLLIRAVIHWVIFLPSFKCRDIGMDCPFEASAPSREELMAKITEHANKVHHLNPPPADLVEKIKKAIEE